MKILELILKRIINLFYRGFIFSKTSYSQEGEDQILLRMFEYNKPGFYVDVGAHHPQRFSNTYLLYRRGWRGINIDANPANMELFRKTRSRDINVAVGIGRKVGKSSFYFFDDPALNTFDKKTAQSLIENTGYKLVKKQEIKTLPLSIVLNKYKPKKVHIDVLTVDVEGVDFEVIKSNDWLKYKPSYILVECQKEDVKGGMSFKECINDNIALYLHDKGYELFAKTVNTLFFRLKGPNPEKR